LVVIGLTADQYALERDAALEGKRVSFLIGYRGKFVRADGPFLPDGGYFWPRVIPGTASLSQTVPQIRLRDCWNRR
jgi:hypothetical protein